MKSKNIEMDFLNNEITSNLTNNLSIIKNEFELSDNNDEFYDICNNSDFMPSLFQFFRCLKYFLSKSVLISSAVLSFSFATAIINIVVIIYINKIKQTKTVFDKIFIAHSFVDFLVGLLVNNFNLFKHFSNRRSIFLKLAFQTKIETFLYKIHLVR